MNKQQILAQKLARLDTLESQKRAMLDEYMPIKNEIINLKDEVEELEMQLLSEEQNVDDKRFDELIESIDLSKAEANEIYVMDTDRFELPTKPWSHADDENDQER